MEAIYKLRDQVHDELVKKYDNAIATGVGHKLVNGVDTGRPALMVFVTEKYRGINKQDISQVIPQEIDGVPVDVVEAGHIVKQAYNTKVRPIVPGFSCSHYMVTAGTLGGIFLDKDDHVVGLSNNHVMANENRCKIGDLIFQPGIADNPLVSKTFVGWKNAPNLPYFATLKDYNKLLVNQKNQHDSAIARVDDSYVTQRMITANYPVGQPMAGFGTPKVGMNVQKFGRTSERTTGKVISLGGEFTVGYDIGAITFIDCIVTTAMSQGGDSGSILFDDNMNAIGLLFAGSDKVSLFNPLGPIISKYGLKIWSPSAQSQIQFWDRLWSRNSYGTGSLLFQPNGLLVVNAYANQHAYVEADLAEGTKSVTLEVFSGNDGGASWGPGLALRFPQGWMKVNIRANTGLGGYWGGTEVYGVGKTDFNSWYTINVTVGNKVTAQVLDKRINTWTKVIETPYSSVGGMPTKIRIGKLDVYGGPGDHSDPGKLGSCQFQKLAIASGTPQILPNGLREL